MHWEAEVAAARRKKQEEHDVAREQARAERRAITQREGARSDLCDTLEQVRGALVLADWPGAGSYKPGFHGYLKLPQMWRGQTLIEMRITEITERISGEGGPDVIRAASVTYYKYPDIADGHLYWVTAGLGGPMRKQFRVRDAKFVGTYLYRLTPEFVLRAAARYCGENNVTLDLGMGGK